MSNETIKLALAAANRKAEFMARFRGVPAHVIACAVTRLTPGINWVGCSKGHLAQCWAGGDWRLGALPLERIAGAVDTVMQPKRQQKKRTAIRMHDVELYDALVHARTALYVINTQRAYDRTVLEVALDMAAKVLGQIDQESRV